MDSSELDDLAKEFAALGADLCGDGENPAVLHRMMQLAVKHIPGCSWASITVLRSGTGRSVASSDPVAVAADQLQYELGQGPCLQAAEEGRNYLLFDVEHEPRWPDYARVLMARTPVRSVLCFDLAGEERAALNLFGAAAGCYDDQAVQFGAVFAAHASTVVALYEVEERAGNLEVALATSRQIGIAIGILMAYHRVTEEDAFALLRTASQHLHIKLRDIAQNVVETGTLPELPPRAPQSTPKQQRRPKSTAATRDMGLDANAR